MKFIQACQQKNVFKFLIFTETDQTLAELRQTSLYQEWTEAITPMLESPRKSRKYQTVYSPLIKK